MRKPMIDSSLPLSSFIRKEYEKRYRIHVTQLGLNGTLPIPELLSDEELLGEYYRLFDLRVKQLTEAE